MLVRFIVEPDRWTPLRTGQGQRNQYSLPRHIEDTTRRDSEDTPPQRKIICRWKIRRQSIWTRATVITTLSSGIGSHRLRSHATMGTLPDGLDNIGDSLPKKMVAPMDIKDLDPTENTNSAELYSKKKITCTWQWVHDPNVENKQSTAPNMGKTRPLANKNHLGQNQQNGLWV